MFKKRPVPRAREVRAREVRERGWRSVVRDVRRGFTFAYVFAFFFFSIFVVLRDLLFQTQRLQLRAVVKDSV